MLGRKRYGGQGGVCHGFARKGSEWQVWPVQDGYGGERNGMAGKHGLVVDWHCKLVLGKAGMAGQGNSRSVVVRNGQFR